MTASTIEDAFRAACLAELAALKAGNVHRHGAGHGMEVAHFEAAAEAAAPCIARRGARVGTRIESAVAASVGATGLNANLGIILLCAPLAAAAELATRREAPLRAALKAVLAGLDTDDARAAYRGIALANPGGLGRVDTEDVSREPAVNLREAMALAATRDRIAQQYTSDFADVWDIGLARLAALESAAPEARTEAVHLAFMAAFPDSHIARKFGLDVARSIRDEAAQVMREIDWQSEDGVRRESLAIFDAALKARGLNPGTSADLTVATLFADALSR